MITLYNVLSSDGFIARLDGSEDFIPDSYWPHTLDFLGKYDCVLLGRKSYETIQSYDSELIDSFEKLPLKKCVVTNNKDYKVKNGYNIIHSPEEVLTLDKNIIVTSGPTLNNYLLENNLVDKIVSHEVPVQIGEGIKPYRSTGRVKKVVLYV